jgi:uncharacterized damage-inducible protein DinB
MITAGYARTMAQYNQVMNERIYTVCAKLSDDDRKRDRGAFFGSIHGTLNHLLWGDLAWMTRFTAKELPVGGPRSELQAEFDALWAARAALDAQIVDWAASLDEHWLRSPFQFYSISYARERRLPAWLLVMHLFNHQTHHRGQLTTLLSQLGVDYGVTDLPFIPLADELESKSFSA